MSLLRTAARASVATRVVGNTHRRQQQQWAQQDAVAAQSTPTVSPPTPPATAQAAPVQGGVSVLDQLSQLGQLRDAGVLTEAEFETQKHHILTNP